MAIHWPVPGVPCPSGTEEARTGHSAPDVASLERSRGGGSPPSTCWPQSSQDTIGPPGHKDTASSRSSCHPPGPPDPSLQSCSLLGQSPTCTGTWGYFSSGITSRTTHFPFLNLIRFLSAQLSSLSQSCWMAAQPSGNAAKLMLPRIL